MRTLFNLPLIYRHRMPSLWRQFGYAIFVFGVCLTNVAGWCSGTEADDEDDFEVAVVPAARKFVLTEQQFDQMVFGGGQQRQVAAVLIVNGMRQVEFTSQPNSESAFRDRIGAAITAEIQAIDERVSLTEAQRTKLRLASRVDVAQFIRRAEELRTILTSKPLNQQQYNELMWELQSLRASQQSGVLGDESLFRQTLRHTLTSDQATKYRALEREWQSRMVNNALVALNAEWGLKVESDKSIYESRHANRQRFVDELLKRSRLPTSHSPYLNYAIFVEIGRLEDHLRPLVVPETWKKLQARVTEARQVEPTLRRSRIWPPNRAEEDEDFTATERE